jgi:hypothetical protein
MMRKLVWNTYFDPGSQLFVSREAFGRKQRRGDLARVELHWSEILKLGAKFDRLNAQPPSTGMKKALTDLVLDALETRIEDEGVLLGLVAGPPKADVFDYYRPLLQ